MAERSVDHEGPDAPADGPLEDTTMVCTWHRDRETLLRCARCGRPMCPECARQHPVGLRCKACASELRSPLYKVSPAGYVAATVVALGAGTAAAAILGAVFALTGGLLSLLVGFAGGSILGAPVAEAVSRAAGRKRGRGLQIATGVGIAGGIAIVTALAVFLEGIAISPLGYLVYAVVAIGTARTRLR